jgi:hypothetical protein
MSATQRTRLTGLLLFLFVGIAAAIGYATSSRDAGPASSAGGNPPTGNGSVVASPSPNANPSSEKPGNGPKDGVFTIAGQVSGLRPGVPSTLPLTLSNPNNWPIQILTVLTGVGTPNQSPCPASTLTVSDYQYANGDPVVQVAARSSIQLSVSIVLADSATQNQTGCPSATFPLTFTGTATKVPGR